MLIHKAYVAELKPNKEQRIAFVRNGGVARFVFNWAIEEKWKYYHETGKTLSRFELGRLLTQNKKTKWQWMYDVSYEIGEGAILNCDRAFKQFFRKRKAGLKASPPSFKSKHRSPIAFRAGHHSFRATHTHVFISRIGWVRLKRKGYIPQGRSANSVTIKEKAGHWFVIAQIDEDIDVRENQTSNYIGIDLGLKDFCVASDGTRIAPPKHYAKALRKLRRSYRQFSRKKKKSSNRHKARRKLARLHCKISSKRRDFVDKTSHCFVAKESNLVLEDLNIVGLSQNRHLSRAIHDSGWGLFKRCCEYKTAWRGLRTILADRFFPSTKRCARCGSIKSHMRLSERTYRCSCGHVADRDLNAALNLEEYGRAGYAQTGWKQPTPAEIANGQSMKQETDTVLRIVTV